MDALQALVSALERRVAGLRASLGKDISTETADIIVTQEKVTGELDGLLARLGEL